MDEPHRRATIRGVTTFLAVAIAGSLLVASADDGRTAGAPSPSSSPSVSVAPPEPLGWLVWVPGGLPAGFGDLIATVPGIETSTTAAADTAWLTASFDEQGNGVDEPRAPMMIPLDVTAVDATYASFVPQPERQLVQNLRADEAIVSESSARLRGLGPGATLVFDGGQRVRIAGTLPDALMGDFEALVTRDTGRRIGVVTDRYALFHVPPDTEPTPQELVERFRDLLPAATPYPAIEVRAPGDTQYLRANDRALSPLALKEAFGEFEAHPEGRATIAIDPAWIQRHIRSATLPGVGSITCHNDVVTALRRVLRDGGAPATIHDVGACFDPVWDPGGPNGTIPASAWGASIELNPSANASGDAPVQPASLRAAMRRAGFVWAGTDAWPQGALFRLQQPAGPTD